MTLGKPEFKWQKLGKIFGPSEGQNRSWMKSHAQAPATLIFDEYVRFYFACRPPQDEDGMFVSYCGFIDVDRHDLFNIRALSKNPVLELGGKGEFDEFGTYPISIIRDDETDTIRAYYAGWTRCESVPFNTAIGGAISHDGGISFEKCGPGPIIPYSLDEPFVMSGPKIRRFNNLWYLFYIAGTKWKYVNGNPEPVYKIKMATSEDGKNWTKHNKNIIESVIEEDEAQASPDVIFANGYYHMFFCYRYSENYRSHDFGYRIGYASSPNLIDWVRDDSRVGIDVSDDGWDSEMVSYPHVFALDGKIYMSYLGNGVGREGFGLAVLDGKLI